MADKNLLDLTTETDRPVVTIDSIAYPLRTARDLTLQDFKFLERVSMRVGDLMSRTRTLTAKENQELEGRLKEVARIALDAPAPVLAKLAAVQRVMIFKVFTELLTPTLILAARAIATDQATAPASTTAAAGSRGRKRSRGSSGATAGRTKRGPHEPRRE
jgi:hypothetical protein